MPSDFNKDTLVLQPKTERTRRLREPWLFLEGDIRDNQEQNGQDDDDLPNTTRAIFYDEGLKAEAELGNATSVGDVDDASTTYQQAINSVDAEK